MLAYWAVRSSENAVTRWTGWSVIEGMWRQVRRMAVIRAKSMGKTFVGSSWRRVVRERKPSAATVLTISRIVSTFVGLRVWEGFAFFDSKGLSSTGTRA